MWERPSPSYPAGYPAFCQLHPDQCRVEAPAKVSWKRWRKTLYNVNRQVNREIVPWDDGDDEDTWSLDVPAGDCEDYALAKRQRLFELGVPWGAMMLALVEHNGEGHAVLIVRTTSGDWVLDNLRDDVLLPSETGHRMVGHVASDYPHFWRASTGE